MSTMLICTVSEIVSGAARSWVASEDTELFELLESSLADDSIIGLMAAQAYSVLDTVLSDEDLGSYEAQEELWDGCVELEGEGQRFIVSFTIVD